MGRKKGSVLELDSPVNVQNSNSKKEDKKMSKTETDATKNAAPVAETSTKKIKFYDLNTFALTEKDVNLTFTPATSLEDAVQRLSASLNGDQSKLTDALNSILEQKEHAAQKRAAIGENGASRKLVLDQIKNYRLLPNFASLVKGEKGKDPNWKSDYNKQTEAILKEISGVPFIVNGIKALAAQDTDTDESEE